VTAVSQPPDDETAPAVEPPDGATSAATPDTATPDGPSSGARPTKVVARSTLRRAPRLGRFVLAGVLVGAFLAATAAVLGPPGAILGRGAIFLLVFLALGTAGAVTGGLVAVLAERRSLRRRPGAS
jgi:hypothetical protein